MQLELTNRGFLRGEFADEYGHSCSIQESSIVSPACIWLGVNDAEPKIMASETPEGGTGWVPFNVPQNVLLHTRMHLNQEQVREILPLLTHFAEYGFLPREETSNGG